MRYLSFNPRWWFTCAWIVAATAGGCQYPSPLSFYQPPPPPQPLGTVSDSIWQQQEANAEASDFVIYQHEFTLNTARLNTEGEDHVKKIAVRLKQGQQFPVIIERSMTTPRATTEYQYPVHPNPELDMQRRAVVVRSLQVLGVEDAENMVVVSNALAEGYTGYEAEQAYNQGIIGGGFGGFGGGFGGGFRGGFGGSFGGGFGGGFF